MSSTLRASSPIAGRLKLCVSMLTGQDGKLLSSDSIVLMYARKLELYQPRTQASARYPSNQRRFRTEHDSARTSSVNFPDKLDR